MKNKKIYSKKIILVFLFIYCFKFFSNILIFLLLYYSNIFSEFFKFLIFLLYLKILKMGNKNQNLQNDFYNYNSIIK
jgi:hypothetical protein